MRYSVLFVLALILISGFIAYFGDILGRRMGKKRLTLFNLRPRYTAIVVTTITGMLISGLAVLALISANREFAKVFSEGERIFSQNKRLSSQNSALARSNRALVERRRELLEKVEERQKALDAARKQVKKAESDRNAASATVKRLEADIAARKHTIELLHARQLALDVQLQQRNEDLDVVQADLRKAQASLDEVKTKLAVVTTNYAAAASDLGKAQANLRLAETKLSDTQKQLLGVEKELLATTRDLAAKQRELVSEKNKRMEAEVLTSQFRSGDLILRQGDEITRGIINPDQPAFGIKADLTSLLEKASESANTKGAQTGDNGRAVSLVFRSPDGSISDKDKMSEVVCLEHARDTIVGSSGSALVQVICARNTVAGQQALVEFVLYRNNLVFSKGDAIASTRLDGRFSEGRVLLSVIEFLQGGVAESAVSKGVVPVANYDPRRALGVNPQKQLDALLDVVDQIRSKRSKVDVTVYACANIYAAGPLNMDNLRFSVIPVKP